MEEKKPIRGVPPNHAFAREDGSIFIRVLALDGVTCNGNGHTLLWASNALSSGPAIYDEGADELVTDLGPSELVRLKAIVDRP